MSESVSQYPVPLIQASLDGYLDCIILQAIFTGLYSHLLYRTIYSAASRIQNRRRIALTTVLILLYITSIINLATTWAVQRSAVITNNETRERMAESILRLNQVSQTGNISGIVGILIADGLLAWRCYMMWGKSKPILGFFGVILLAETALILVLVAISPSVRLNPYLVPGVILISAGVTIIATSLIIYRIVTISRAAGVTRKYLNIVEILIESGLLYSILLLFNGIISVLHDNSSLFVTEAGLIVSSVLVPVTGIAPTMIFERVFNSADEDEAWSKPISSIKFHRGTSENSLSVRQS